MIAAQMPATLRDRHRQSAVRKSTRADRAARERAVELLTTEVAFIPNPSFQEMDLDEAWVEILDQAEGDESDNLLSSAPGQLRMPAHLERLCSAPLLSPSQERELFCQMNYLRYRANSLRSQLSPEAPQTETIRQIDRLIRAATTIRNRIIHANIRLVMSIVKQFADDKNRFDDLLSEGISCLIKAVDKFDFDRGFRFSTYATRAVRREVFRLVQRQHRDRGRFSTGTQELLSQELNRKTDPESVDMSWEHVDESINSMLTVLDDREKFIVGARYGFDDIGDKPTFQRLGEILGVSKERVRQIEQRALGKLRDMAQSLRLEPAF